MKLELTVADRLLNDIFPGNVYAIGGRVRDALFAHYHGMVAPSKDADYLVVGTTFTKARDRLATVGPVSQVGMSFPCVKLAVGGETIDIAFPRGRGGRGNYGPDERMVALREDIELRDFTINGASYRIADGMLFTHEHTLRDIRERRLRMSNISAFPDDPTRMWRAVQFVSRFGLTVDAETEATIRQQAWRISGEAPERIGEELCKLLGRSPSVEPGFELARRTGLLERTLPAVARAYGVEQNTFHAFDVYGHTIAAVQAAGPNMVDRLAALCHDLGKPETRREGGPHGATFYGHEEVGADITHDMLSRLKMPMALVNATSTLVREHMYATAPTLTDAAVRRFIKRVGPELIERQFTLRHADVVGCGFERPESIEMNAVFEARVRRALSLAPALTPKDLAIDGREVVAALIAGGVRKPGYRGDKAVGDILGRLVDDVIEDPLLNTSDRLKERVAAAVDDLRLDAAPRPERAWSL